MLTPNSGITWRLITCAPNIKHNVVLMVHVFPTRWFLDVLGYPRTAPLFMANGIAMAAMFFMVRVVCIPPFWTKVISIYGTDPCNDLGKIYWVMVSSCIVLDTMNIIWFLKIWRGARKILRMASENKMAQAKAA